MNGEVGRLPVLRVGSLPTSVPCPRKIDTTSVDYRFQQALRANIGVAAVECVDGLSGA